MIFIYKVEIHNVETHLARVASFTIPFLLKIKSSFIKHICLNAILIAFTVFALSFPTRVLDLKYLCFFNFKQHNPAVN